MTAQLYTDHCFKLPEMKDGHCHCPKVITTEAKNIENCQRKLAAYISEKDFKKNTSILKRRYYIQNIC